MKAPLLLFLIFTCGALRAEDFWAYGSPKCHVSIKNIRSLQEINFPDEALGTSPSEAAQLALGEFATRFPGAQRPLVESVHLRRFPEEYGKNRFFYAVQLRPLDAQTRDSFGSMLGTKAYQVLVALPFKEYVYSCALPVIESPKQDAKE